MTQVEIRDVTLARQYLRISIKPMVQGRCGNLVRVGLRAALNVYIENSCIENWIYLHKLLTYVLVDVIYFCAVVCTRLVLLFIIVLMFLTALRTRETAIIFSIQIS